MMIFAANHLCHAVIGLVLHYRQAGDPQRPPLRLRRHWRRLMRFLATYAKIYPPGEAHLLYQRGRWADLCGNQDQAIMLWRRALAAAARFEVQDAYAVAAERLLRAGADAADPERLARARGCTGLEGLFAPY
jgi:hypothetical protein